MINGLSTPLYNPAGAVLLHCEASSDIGGVTRRVSRTATLDGEATITDFGITNSDTTIRLKIPLTMAIDDTIRLMVRQNPLLVLTTRLGCFLGAVDSYRVDNGTGILSFLVKSTLSEI
jgi:hypothetical protein